MRLGMLLSLSVLSGLLILSFRASHAQGGNELDAQPLELGTALERELKSGETHLYRLTLGPDQYAQVTIDQHGIEVAASLFGPDGRRRTKGFFSGESLVTVATVADTVGAYRLEVRASKEKAAGQYTLKVVALRTATTTDRTRAQAQLVYGEGEDLQTQGKTESLQQALEKFDAAFLLWRAIEDRRGEGCTLLSLASVYYDTGEKQKSVEYYEQALRAKRDVGDRQGEAATLNGLGLAMIDLGNRPQGVEAFEQTLQISRAIGDRLLESRAMNNIGLAHWQMGDIQTALDYYLQALVLRRQMGNPALEAPIYHNLAEAYRRLGDADQALEYAQQALDIRRRVKDIRGQAATLQTMGNIYQGLLNDATKALQCLEEAAQISKEVGFKERLAFSVGTMASVYAKLGETQKALEYNSQALTLWREMGVRRGEAQILLQIGANYAELGNHDLALDQFRQSLAINQAIGERPFEAAAHASIARNERERGHLAEARTNIEAALAIVESLRAGVASQDLRATYFATVRDYYDFYADLLMRLHDRQPTEGHDAEALAVSERTRARSLLDTLAEARIDFRQGVDPALIERERKLRDQLNAKAEYQTRLRGGKPTPEQLASVAQEINALTTSLQEVEAQIRETSPRYTALMRPQLLTLKEIQALLDQDTLLLEYALGQEQSYVWAVGTDSLKSYKLAKRSELEAVAGQVYELLTARNHRITGETPQVRRQRVADADLQYWEKAAELSRMLLGPVAAHLKAKRLLIVADGKLQFVPFAALPMPVVSGQSSVVSEKKIAYRPPTTDHQPLIVEHEIVSLPSASVLAVLRQEAAQRPAATKTVAVLADPVFDKDDPRLLSAKRQTETNRAQSVAAAGSKDARPDDLLRLPPNAGITDAGLTIPRLLATRQEAQAITAMAPSNKALKAIDFAASRQMATNPTLSDYRMLHFATHAVVNYEHPELSGLILSLIDERGAPQDGFLRLHDIYNLKLGADLVVLSACNTALGKEIKGEGLLGLTRGFMYAGSARVLASLWKVDDDATADLMPQFYRRMLADGKTPASALRSAQVAMWQQKRWQAPYYWAAFTLLGEWK